jgi:hypothetical protein
MASLVAAACPDYLCLAHALAVLTWLRVPRSSADVACLTGVVACSLLVLSLGCHGLPLRSLRNIVLQAAIRAASIQASKAMTSQDQIPLNSVSSSVLASSQSVSCSLTSVCTLTPNKVRTCGHIWLRRCKPFSGKLWASAANSSTISGFSGKLFFQRQTLCFSVKLLCFSGKLPFQRRTYKLLIS